jgi:hypothetical protein
MESRSLNERLLPKLIAASAALTVREFFKVGGIKGFALFLLIFVAVGFAAESFLYSEEVISKKRKLIGVLIFIFLTAIYSYLKVEHRYLFF